MGQDSFSLVLTAMERDENAVIKSLSGRGRGSIPPGLYRVGRAEDHPYLGGRAFALLLGNLRIGSPVRLLTAKKRAIEGRVTELRPLGEFATWRAARAAGDHDLNSFLVRIDPTETKENLQPGMTVWLEPGGLPRG